MKVMQRPWLIITSLFFLNACAIKALDAPPLMVEAVHDFQHVEKIRIEGPFDVDLHTGYRHHQAIVKGDQMALAHLEIKTNDGVLTFRCPQKCAEHGQIAIKIEVQRLRDFVYRGQGRITGTAIHAPLLNLSIRNSGVTNLGGYLGLRRVVLSGGFTTLSGVKSRALFLTLKNHARLQLKGEVQLASLNLQTGSWLSMYWLKGDRLELRGRGDTVLQFAGAVNVLDVELWGHAKFNGRYIHAQETFVKTHDHAIAEISTWGYQHTLATDASDIYYFNVPKAQTDFMALNGAVLNFEDWTPGRRGNLFTPIRYN
jgi:hypothetical protein